MSMTVWFHNFLLLSVYVIQFPNCSSYWYIYLTNCSWQLRPRCYPQNIIWTEVAWTICYIILNTCKSVRQHVFCYCISKTKKWVRTKSERKHCINQPSQYSVFWTGLLTKTNRENINLRYYYPIMDFSQGNCSPIVLSG